MSTDRLRLLRRVEITADLVTTTGLHIGGGKTGLGTTDDTVVRSADGRPFIPGSSFKGALRATAEKLGASVGLWCCGLAEPSADTLAKVNWSGGGGQVCVGTQRGARSFQDYLRKHRAAVGEAELLAALWPHLCDTCRLFGSHWMASKVLVDDLPLLDPVVRTEVRDGVGIDRDAERAAPEIKFDFETVPSQCSFRMRVVAENVEPYELGLLAAALAEFRDGFAGLGGKRSRGLGRCRLDNVRVSDLDFTSPETLVAYLARRDLPCARGEEVDRWFAAQTEELLLKAGLV